MTLFSYQVVKITLGITRQSTLYTDARPGMMPQRSGGLEKSKLFIQTKQRSSTKDNRVHVKTPYFRKTTRSFRQLSQYAPSFKRYII